MYLIKVFAAALKEDPISAKRWLSIFTSEMICFPR
jgi:hypothetical protein